MKFQGKVINWNDEKGFGFVEPDGGGSGHLFILRHLDPVRGRPLKR